MKSQSLLPENPENSLLLNPGAVAGALKPMTVRLGGCAVPWGPCATLRGGYDIPAAPYLGCPENMGQLNQGESIGQSQA